MPLRLNCKEASRLLSQAEDLKLPLLERVALGLHVRACDYCTHFSRQLAFLRKAMQAYPGPASNLAEEKNTR